MKFIKCLFLLVILTLIPKGLFAQEINRHILALVDGAEIKDPVDNYLASWAEMPLNHLGFILDFVDVSKRLPTDEEMKKYPVMISWFKDNQLKGARKYANWLTRQLNKGKKILIIDEFGFEVDEKNNLLPEKLLNNFLKAFHISYDYTQNTNSPLIIEITKNVPAVTEFERQLKGDLRNFQAIRPLDSNATVYLQLKRRDTGTIGDAIFKHSRGGFIAGDYVSYDNPFDYQRRWKINPFIFFKDVFGGDFPKPDVTTMNGMRIFISHIDGDGLRNLSYVDNKSSCGKIAYDRIFTRYNLPITSSVLIGDILKTGGKREKTLTDTVREIFKLPNIEPASHGWAHPFVWKEDGRKMAMSLFGYEFSPQNEIGNAIDYINENLAPKNKPAKLFLWTGDCEPDYDSLKYTFDHNLLNMNGGDTRLDNDYPSYSYVSPLFRHVEDLVQTFAPMANEVTYTNGWEGPFYGFRYVIETLKNTNAPMRVKPIDVYYHIFIAEYDVSIATVYEAYNWSLDQEIYPAFATDYARAAKGFLTTRINEIAPLSWEVLDNGALRTVRLDDFEGYADTQRSIGVLGSNIFQGSTYVHLDNGTRSVIHLSASPSPSPYIVKASGEVKDWKMESGHIDFKTRVMGRIQFTIGSITPGQKYNIKINNKDFYSKSNAKGELSFTYNVLSNVIRWIHPKFIDRKPFIPRNIFEWASIAIKPAV